MHRGLRHGYRLLFLRAAGGMETLKSKGEARERQHAPVRDRGFRSEGPGDDEG